MESKLHREERPGGKPGCRNIKKKRLTPQESDETCPERDEEKYWQTVVFAKPREKNVLKGERVSSVKSCH